MKLLDPQQVADLLGLNADHIRDRLSKRKGFPPAYRIGGLRWKADDIEAWIESRKLAPAARKPKRRKEAATT
jgi:predicted DNA-binding transcriptional regulator AlpA